MSTILLAGCDGRAPWRSAEHRINAAIPVAAAVLDARSRLDQLVGSDDSAAGSLEAEYQTRLRLRALTCAQDSPPSLLESATSLRNRLPAACFEKADAELLTWLRQRRLQRLLSAPALRELPATAPQLVSATQNISLMRIAAEAGIAVVSSGRSVEVIDIATDKSLYSNPALPGTALEVSPNGRVFALGGNNEGVMVRDATNGDELAAYPEHSRLVWLDSTSALLLRNGGGQGLELLDFDTGQLQAVKGVSGSSTTVMPLPPDRTRFLLAEYGTLSVFGLSRGADGLRFTLTSQASGTGMSGSESALALASDGKRLIQTQRSDPWITDLQTLKQEQVPLAGARVGGITTLTDPDKVLLLVHASGEPSPRHMVYSLSRQTFATVPEGVMTGIQSGGSPLRAMHFPSIARIGILNGRSVRFMDELPTGTTYSIQAFGALIQEMGRQSQQNAARAEARRMGYALLDTVNGEPVLDSPMAQLAKGARVEAIGVYEPAGGVTGAGVNAIRRKMPITVIVRRSDKPIVLSLSSYEAVSWRLSVQPGVQLRAVLLSGYKDSTVEGAGSARVHNIGTTYAYKSDGGNLDQLRREILRWTGAPISYFQGKYTGSSFEVGGR